VGQVHLDGAGGDEQPLGDGLVPQAVTDQADDLQFGGSQAGPAGGGTFATAALAGRLGSRVRGCLEGVFRDRLCGSAGAGVFGALSRGRAEAV
jgi:hypothetical protein